ncbi:MAG: hypothetical protein A2506_09960 [Elusimicrobia bacterium RIFOXYD12_FULL_66_9]|nr:MAG: hypothetical protein A2506_09960 [Elusimicrobia bacterium RIFOXYD12_FULL_66_9]
MLGLANGSPILLGLGALALLANAALAVQVGSTRLMTNTQQTGQRMTALGALLIFASIAAIWVLSVVTPGIAVGLAGTLALLAAFVTGAVLVLLSMLGSLRWG